MVEFEGMNVEIATEGHKNNRSQKMAVVMVTKQSFTGIFSGNKVNVDQTQQIASAAAQLAFVLRALGAGDMQSLQSVSQLGSVANTENTAGGPKQS